ncbi:hypothetical protein ABH975_002416 [Bradyrhizobium ottawaense]
MGQAQLRHSGRIRVAYDNQQYVIYAARPISD